MRLGLSLSRKKVEWKCCIKPLIRVEHIRIILRAQSGSCYAAACVVLLATEFPPLIGVHISVWMNWECLVCACVCSQCGIWCGVCVCVSECESWFGNSLRCVCSSRRKAGSQSVIRSHGWKSRWGSLFLLLYFPLILSVLCCPRLSIFFLSFFSAQLTSLNDSQLWL